jgi:hypothetical protein
MNKFEVVKTLDTRGLIINLRNENTEVLHFLCKWSEGKKLCFGMYAPSQNNKRLMILIILV